MLMQSEITSSGFVSGDQDLMNRLMAAETELQVIKGGKSYKICQALKNIRFPFKNRLRAIAFRMAKWFGWIEA